MTQSNTSSLWGSEIPLESQRRWWQLMSPQKKEISEGGKNGGRKGVGSAIRRRGANRGAYTLKNDSEGEW